MVIHILQMEKLEQELCDLNKGTKQGPNSAPLKSMAVFATGVQWQHRIKSEQNQE